MIITVVDLYQSKLIYILKKLLHQILKTEMIFKVCLDNLVDTGKFLDNQDFVSIVGCISLILTMYFSKGNPFAAKTVQLLLWSFEKKTSYPSMEFF